MPKIHNIPVNRRGILIRSDLYFCFDVYEDNEQLEPGDTLIHTFDKPDWPYCQTRWFYFHGTIDGIASKSTSPVFHIHNVAPPPTQLFEYCDTIWDPPWVAVFSSWRRGQTFTPKFTQEITNIKLFLGNKGQDWPPHPCIIAPVTVRIQGTIEGVPDDAQILATKTFSSAELPCSTTVAYVGILYNIPFTPKPKLYHDVMYAITVAFPAGDPYSPVVMRQGSGYTRGTAVTTTSPAFNWVRFTPADIQFWTYGYPL